MDETGSKRGADIPGETRTPENDEVYKQIRSEIQSEYARLNARVNWLVASQTFLFLPLSLSSQRPEGGLDLAGSVFFPLIPYLGMLLCLLALTGVIGAVWQIENWKAKYARGAYAGRQEHRRFSIIKPRNPLVPLMGHVASVGIPLVLLSAWLVVRFALAT